jgi:hypothetical protein
MINGEMWNLTLMLQFKKIFNKVFNKSHFNENEKTDCVFTYE